MNQLSICFRVAETKDFESLGKLRWDFVEEDYKNIIGSKENFSREFAEWSRRNKNCYHFLAEDGGLAIAMMSLIIIDPIPRPLAKNRPIGYLTNSYTIPKYRNKNIGSNLLKIVKDWAQDKDCETVIVWPSEKSIPFYNRSGFQSENEIMEFLSGVEIT